MHLTRTLLLLFLSFVALDLYAQDKEQNIKMIILYYPFPLPPYTGRISVAYEQRALTSTFAGQITFELNWDLYYRSEEGWRFQYVIMPELRVYPLKNFLNNFYLAVFPRLVHQSVKSHRDIPLHLEQQFGGGVTLGNKFRISDRWLFEINAGAYYFSTITDYKDPHLDYHAWRPKLNIHFVRRIGRSSKTES